LLLERNCPWLERRDLVDRTGKLVGELSEPHIFDLLGYFKPVELSEYGCDMISSFCARYNEHDRVTNTLQYFNIGLGIWNVPYKMALQ